MMIVIAPPRFDFAPGVVDRQELVGIEAFIPQSAVEGFDKAVLHGLSGPDEGERHALGIGPGIECLALELRSMVESDGSLQTAGVGQCSRTATTGDPVSEVSTSMARHSWVHSSTRARQRMRRPSASRSATKSMDQLTLAWVGFGSGLRSMRPIRLRLRRRTANPASRKADRSASRSR